MPRRSHADVEVGWAARVPTGDVRLVSVSPLAIASLYCAMLIVILPVTVGRPPLNPGTREWPAIRAGLDDAADHQPTSGALPLWRIRLVEGPLRIRTRRRANRSGWRRADVTEDHAR